MSKTVYLNCRLFDGTKNALTKQAWFEVDNEKGKLTQTGSGKYEGTADQTIDLHNQYVMPGLVDAHTHIFMNALTNKLYYLTEAEVTLQALENLRLTLTLNYKSTGIIIRSLVRKSNRQGDRCP